MTGCCGVGIVLSFDREGVKSLLRGPHGVGLAATRYSVRVNATSRAVLVVEPVGRVVRPGWWLISCYYQIADNESRFINRLYWEVLEHL